MIWNTWHELMFAADMSYYFGSDCAIYGEVHEADHYVEMMEYSRIKGEGILTSCRSNCSRDWEL